MKLKLLTYALLQAMPPRPTTDEPVYLFKPAPVESLPLEDTPRESEAWVDLLAVQGEIITLNPPLKLKPHEWVHWVGCSEHHVHDLAFFLDVHKGQVTTEADAYRISDGQKVLAEEIEVMYTVSTRITNYKYDIRQRTRELALEHEYRHDQYPSRGPQRKHYF